MDTKAIHTGCVILYRASNQACYLLNDFEVSGTSLACSSHYITKYRPFGLLSNNFSRNY